MISEQKREWFTESLDKLMTLMKNAEEHEKEAQKIKSRYGAIYKEELKSLTEEYDQKNKEPNEPEFPLWTFFLGPYLLVSFIIHLIRKSRYKKKSKAYAENRARALEEFPIKAKAKAEEDVKALFGGAMSDKLTELKEKREKLLKETKQLFAELNIPKEYQDISHVKRLQALLVSGTGSFEQELKDAYDSLRPAKVIAAEKAEKHFQELLAANKADDIEAKRAADAGSLTACFYLGEKWFNKFWDAVIFCKIKLTNKELESLYSAANKYLSKASAEGMEKATILLIALKLIVGRLPHTEYEKTLSKLRYIQESGKYPEYDKMIFDSTDILVTLIDRLDENGNVKETGSYSCRYYDHGICRYYTNGYHTHNCEYYGSPGMCSTAVNENAVIYAAD